MYIHTYVHTHVNKYMHNTSQLEEARHCLCKHHMLKVPVYVYTNTHTHTHTHRHIHRCSHRTSVRGGKEFLCMNHVLSMCQSNEQNSIQLKKNSHIYTHTQMYI